LALVLGVLDEIETPNGRFQERRMLGYLRVIAGPDDGRMFNLDEGQKMLIGRSEKTDTRLKDLQVSRIHCEVQGAGGKIHITDNESVGGTFVKCARVQECTLKEGDIIQIGTTQLRVHLAGIPDADTVVAAQKPKPVRDASPDSPGLTGTTISHYEIGPRLARGKSGTVYKAKDTRDGRAIAFKVMHEGFTDDEDDVQRFIRAMETARSLKHPNIVALYGAGKNGSVCWIAMEYVDGESLAKVIDRIGTVGMLDWKYALTVAVHIARALDAAHAQHVVHRNVMPENILIPKGPTPSAKLGDFMLAKALDGIKAKAITKPGELVGDLVYMAPERTRTDAAVDTRSDIYSLGATLYVLLTGHPPFEGTSMVEMLKKVRQEDPVPPKKYQLSIPDAFQDLVLKMMAKRPEMRVQDPVALVRELERIAKYQGMSF
jgi:pSer/pThr/pTyr-binding forkhead associated (FHA) protein